MGGTKWRSKRHRIMEIKMIAKIRMPCVINQAVMFIPLRSIAFTPASLPDASVYASIVELRHQLIAKLLYVEARNGSYK